MKRLIPFLILKILLSSSFGNSQNIWTNTNGPKGLNLSAFTKTSDDLLVASATNSGIYFSDDLGITWHQKSNGLNGMKSYATSLAAGENGIVYAIIEAELYKIDKNSDVWIRTNNKFKLESQVFANQDGFVFVISTVNGSFISISKDKGISFKSILNDDQFSYIESFSLNGNDKNYLLQETGSYNANLYKLSDDGSKMIKIYSDMLIGGQVYWHPSGKLFLHGYENLFYSLDSLGKNMKYISSYASYATVVTMKPDGNILIMGHYGDFISVDTGKTWIKINSAFYKKAQYGDLFYFINNKVFAWTYDCSEGELIMSDTNAANRITFDIRFTNPLVNNLFIDKSNNVFAYTCFNNKYSFTKDQGMSWQSLKLPSNDKNYSDLITSFSDDLFVLSDTGLYKSADLGKSWNEIKLNNTSSFKSLTGDSDSTLIVYGESGFRYISNDGGLSWKTYQDAEIELGPIRKHPDGTLFANNKYGTFRVHYSMDHGIHWNLTPAQLEAYAFHIARSGTIYSSGYSNNFLGFGIFVSFDKMNTMIKVNQNEFGSIVSDSKENLYGFKYYDVCMKSTDGGNTWLDYSIGQPVGSEATSLVVDKNQYLFISFYNDLVYKTIKPVNTVVSNKNEISSELISILPNPIENNLNINISDINISSGHYKILDLNGIEILKGNFNSNNFTIDCSSLANGMAFIQIFGNDKFYSSEKIVIVH